MKIAALTASVFDEERDTVLAAGIDDFLRKPFRAKTVFECMRRLLGVRYVRSAPSDDSPFRTPESHGLARIAALPEELKAQLLRRYCSWTRNAS